MPQKQKSGGSKKIGRNAEKCKRYRLVKGKPCGPGRDGQKAGKNAGCR